MLSYSTKGIHNFNKSDASQANEIFSSERLNSVSFYFYLKLFIQSLNINKMLVLSHNPIQRVSHSVINHPKHFAVEYKCLITGKTKVEYYAVPLTKKEIEAEYDYISF